MTLEDQKVHMKNLVSQAKDLSSEVNNLQAQMNTKRDLLLKVQGAIEYLQQVGVPFPEQTEVSESVEESGSDSDVAVAEVMG